MKKILLGVLLCLLLAAPVHALTATQTTECYGDGYMCVFTFSWTGSSGSVTMLGTEFQKFKGFYAFPIFTVPGVAPTNLYDIVLTNEFGDLAMGLLGDRSSTVAQQIVPYVNTAGTVYGGNPILAPVTLTITNQSEAAGTGRVVMVLWRN